ncbi:zinc transporter ZIP3-like [Lycorma delicatula]|uniref:zinc transporter ZIP3-like n=1 Tax=Lycorma delicatula TaxID=130591 RepID=UPI003F51302F
MEFDKNSTVMSKLCGMALITISSIIIGLSPMIIHSHFRKRKLQITNDRKKKKSKYKRVLSHMSAFGGGVLLSTAFLHLLPEIRASIETLQFKKTIPYFKSMPLAELLMCVGFLFLYLLEEIAHRFVSHKNRQQDSDGGDRVADLTDSVEVTSTPESTVNRVESLDDSDTNKTNFLPLNDRPQIQRFANIENRTGTINDAVKDATPAPPRSDNAIFFTKGSGKNFLLIFALSIHEGFEGLAIGLESQPDAVWYMIVGVGAHKAVIAFCIGVQMLSSELDFKVTVLYVSLFGSATSLGVAVGLFLYTESGILSVILQGLATGTLLHVVFFEMLKSHSEDCKTPFSGVFLGFTCMAVLKYFSP